MLTCQLQNAEAVQPTKEIDGIPCKLADETFAAGTDIQEILAGNVEPISRLWTSDGAYVGTWAWCEGHCGPEHDNAVYWCREGENHGHGWACGKCRKVTQTG